MKINVLDYHKAKEELVSMDDELPIIIYIIIMSSIKNLISKLQFLSDYIQYDPNIESEKRLITNLLVTNESHFSHFFYFFSLLCVCVNLI